MTHDERTGAMAGHSGTAALGGTGILRTDAGGNLRTRSFRVIVRRGASAGAEASLEAGTLLVGSHPDNDLVLRDPTVSRYHLELQLVADGVRVRDVGSKNGTRFVGSKLADIVLADGGLVEPGDAAIELVPVDAELPPEERPSFGHLAGVAPATRRLFGVLHRLAATDATVLLLGETGTGKEEIARALHAEGARRERPFVVVDCGALPRHLLQAELFGHVRGAFSGAETDRAGLFEVADGGTVFLDEIGEMPLELQPLLLRVLEQREVRRLGETTPRRIDVRVLAATHRDLEGWAAEGKFRRDLFYRLAVCVVRVPPLRERPEDISPLVQRFLAEQSRRSGGRGGPHPFLPDRALLERLAAYAWPGNVRELKNAVARATLVPPEEAFGELPEAPPVGAGGLSPELLRRPYKEAREALDLAFERAYVEALLERNGGNVSAAAREAGIERAYLHRLRDKHGLKRR